jgi:2-keto-4-pentenoate hydratase
MNAMNPTPPLPPADTLQSAADALRQARATGRPIARSSESHAIAGVDAAYALAALNTRARLAEGRRIVGKKIGLTSRAVQQQLGVNEPDFGMLFDDMELLDGHALPAARLMQPKVEAELAFVVGRDLRHQAPAYAEFVAALDCALPAIEIVDSTIADWRITLVEASRCRPASWCCPVRWGRWCR